MKKDVKNYSYKNLPQEDLDLISKTCEEYAKAYNYFSERYSGIKNIVNTSSILSTRKNLRDPLYKDICFRREIPLPVSLWKCALEDATSNIRSVWSNVFEKIRKVMYRNEFLDDTQKHLINYLFKDKVELEKVLNQKHPKIPEKFLEEITEIKFKRTCVLLRRYIRKYKPLKSKNCKKRSYNLTPDMYTYKKKGDVLYISIVTCKRGKRIEIPLKSDVIFTKNIRLVLDQDRKRIILHACIDTQTSNELPIKNKEIGLDKGVKKVISTSTRNTYGTDLSKILDKKILWEDKKIKGRQLHLQAYQKALKEGNLKKAERILENNLGKKRWNRIENKYQETIKSRVNQSLRTFFKEEHPETIIVEDLTFTSWTKPMKGKNRRKLASWYKGYIEERLVYLAEYYQCKVIHINPAYTSQVCSHCGNLDKESRKGEKYKCIQCGYEEDADINGAINILHRSKDKRINIYTSYKQVKEILERKN